MEAEKNKIKNLFNFLIVSNHKALRGGVFTKGRILVGRSESCDLCIAEESVSAVHAVIEIFDQKAIIYDMNSTNGTFVNGEKVIVKEIKLGDMFSLGRVDIRFLKYANTSSNPPVLESLDPVSGKAKTITPQRPIDSEKKLPEAPEHISQDIFPQIVYPLSSDPKAEFSEYIFEDKEEIYPIFKYDHSKQSVEVIVLYKDNIFSIDYLPERKGKYYISGVLKSKDDIEFPYLGKNEKFPFVSVFSGRVTVNSLPGFDLYVISDKKNRTSSPLSEVDLEPTDIVRLSKDNLQIFVRNVSSPPKVAAAPILKRDPEFQKYLFSFLALVLLISISFNLIEVPEDTKKDELAPERLATILYKQPLTVSKNKAVEKTNDAPKEIAQKAPPKPAVEKQSSDQPKVEVKKPDVTETKIVDKKPDPGKVKAQEKKVVKQGNPNQIQASPKKANNDSSSLMTKVNASKQSAPSALSQVKSAGHVEVYKSADFKSSLSSLMAKGGSLSGMQSKGVETSTGDLVGAGPSVSSGTGSIKTATISTSQGSLVGASSGSIGDSKGAEGLSSKRAVYTAGIPSETVVLGGMDPDIIRKILLDHLPQFRYCYQKELERSGAEVSGVVKLNFTIGASGHVSQAGVDGSSGIPSDVKKCVIGVLRGISFPEPNGGGVVEVKQPMNFYPKKI